MAEIWEWWALEAEGSSAATVQIEQRGRYTYRGVYCNIQIYRHQHFVAASGTRGNAAVHTRKKRGRKRDDVLKHLRSTGSRALLLST